MSMPSTFDTDKSVNRRTVVPPEALKLLESRAFEPVSDPVAKSFSRPRSRWPKNSSTFNYKEKDEDGTFQKKIESCSYSSINDCRTFRNDEKPNTLLVTDVLNPKKSRLQENIATESIDRKEPILPREHGTVPSAKTYKSCSYSSIDVSRRVPKEEAPSTSLVTDVLNPKNSRLQENIATESIGRKEPILPREHGTVPSAKTYKSCSYSSIDVSRRVPKEEAPSTSLVTDVFSTNKSRLQENIVDKSTDRGEVDLAQEHGTPPSERNYVPCSYSSIDVSRRVRNEEEPHVLYETDDFSPKKSNIQENTANESIDREEPKLTQEHRAPPSEKNYEPCSYSSIDVSRRVRNEEASNVSYDTDVFSPKKFGLQEKIANESIDRGEVNLAQEHGTPPSERNYVPCSYSSIDVSRRVRNEEEPDDSYLTNANDSHESNTDEEIETGGSDRHDLPREQGSPEIPDGDQYFVAEPYGLISLEKRPRSENQQCEKKRESLLMIDDSEKKHSDNPEVDAKAEDANVENSSPSNQAVSCRTTKNNPFESRKKNHYVNRKFVAHPKKIIEGNTPQRPFPKDLYWCNPTVSGTATELFDMIFPASSKKQPKYQPWTHGNFEAPMIHFRKLEEKRQETLRSYIGIEEDERKRQKLQNILESVQNILWLVHSQKKNEILEKTLRLMLQKFLCRLDEDQKLKIISNEDLSLIWNGNIGTENSSILSQREFNWDIKPVFIDGLSLIDSICSDTSNLPILPTKVLIEGLLHFVLDGHKTAIYLPDVYKFNSNVDDLRVFNFLCNLELITFVDKRNRKSVERAVLADAENSCGIIVSTSEDLSQHIFSSVQCFPALNKYSTHEVILNTIFAERNGSNANVESSDGSNDQGPEIYQDLSKRCRIYTESEKEKIDASQHQLTLERQVYLVSSLVHIATFHFQRQRQIEVFLMAINRFVPQLLPHFMQKSTLDEISVAIQTLQERNNLQNWPIFSNQ